MKTCLKQHCTHLEYSKLLTFTFVCLSMKYQIMLLHISWMCNAHLWNPNICQKLKSWRKIKTNKPSLKKTFESLMYRMNVNMSWNCIRNFNKIMILVCIGIRKWIYSCFFFAFVRHSFYRFLLCFLPVQGHKTIDKYKSLQ